MSVVLPRQSLFALDFEGLDPSDAIEQFKVRSSLKLSRKTAVFEAIMPWTIDELRTERSVPALSQLRRNVHDLHQQIALEMERFFE
jgi:hypothetical protein